MKDQSLPNQNLVRQLDGTDLNSEPVSGTKIMSKRNSKPRVKKILIATAIVIGIFLAFGLIFVLRPAKKMLASVSVLQTLSNEAADALKKQDLGLVNTKLSQIEDQMKVTQADLTGFSWMKIVPFANRYYQDGVYGLSAGGELITASKVAIQAITPYADILGLKGLASTGDGAKTAEDRINFILNTLDKVKPQLEQIGVHLEKAKVELSHIDPNRYPTEFRGMALRPIIVTGISLVDQAAVLTNDARPLLEKSPYLLGMESPRKYLLLFQNDAELRPTGGFMTAYSIVQVHKGKLSIIQSNDIYTLDEKFPGKIAAPQPILKYLPKVPYWYLRDQNLSPDYKVSMDTFYPNYLKTKSPEVDGVVSIDTQVLVNLLKITGPIGVSGFGTYSAENDKRCNCPQVFYELESFADVEGPVVWDSVSGNIVFQPRNYGNRKSFIGPMMQAVMSNVMAQPKSRMGNMFSAAMDLIAAKHIQFYFLDADAQKAAETFNLSGRIRETDKDYLFVVDTNFAGAKTNAWVEYSADLKIETGSTENTNTLTLTYKNPQHYFEDPKTKLKLNGVFRDWLRVYVPKGSKLIETKGFETGEGSGEDLDKTVIEGFFTLTPLNTKTITIKYKTPVKSKSPYELLIQKQAGSKAFPYEIIINNKKQPEVILDSDKELLLSY